MNIPITHNVSLNPVKLRSPTRDEIRLRFDTLTPRQQQICLLIVSGMMNKVIANQIGASINTIKTHRTEIMRKMEAASLLDLARQLDLLNGHNVQAIATDPDCKILLQSLRVIVVEDHDVLRQTMVCSLNVLGHVACGARDSAELYQIIATDPVDIVLLDIGLGQGDDGFSIAARLRRTVRCGIVMVTARAELDARIRGLEEGADAYLVKPVDFGELSAVMQSVMRRLSNARQPV